MGDLSSSSALKNFVVGINYPSSGCGRTSQHISFADRRHMNNLGQMFEYGVRAVQNIRGRNNVTFMTTAPYRIPFLTTVGGTVTTGSNVGVPGVKVSFCHIDPVTAVNDVDADYCPLQTFVTDKRGQFSGDLRVSNVKWVNQMEYFNVTASLVETMSDGTVISHDFSPASLIVTNQHLGSSSISITDTTTVTVFGKVIFDPNIVDQNICPFAGVPIVMMEDSGTNQTVTSALDGSFKFSLTRGEAAFVYIPSFNGYTWNSLVTTINTAKHRRLSAEEGPKLVLTSMESSASIEKDRGLDEGAVASSTGVIAVGKTMKSY